MPRSPPAVQQLDICLGSYCNNSCRRCNDGRCTGFIQHHTWRNVCRRCHCELYWHVDSNDPENHIYENPSDYASVAYSAMSTLSSDGGNDLTTTISANNSGSKSSFGNQTLSSMDSDSLSLTGNMRSFCLSPSTKLRLAADAHRQSTSDDDSGCVMDEYVWIPRGLKPDLIHQYFSGLPGGRGAYSINFNDKWRNKRSYQLPNQDFESRSCRHLAASEQKSFKTFAQKRQRAAFGEGVVKPIPYSLNGTCCGQCTQEVCAGDLGVFAPKAGDKMVWHPSCFVCHTCRELLIELLYFYKDGQVFCGRHHAELEKPRCAACDELIFANECTEADNRCWHVHHFSCFECDKTLGGTKYVTQDERPYCVDCFNNLFRKVDSSNVCSSCKRVLNKTDALISQSDRKWHATKQCFSCVSCRRSLLGETFAANAEGLLFCGDHCENKFRQLEKSFPKKPTPNGRKLRSHSASGRQRKASNVQTSKECQTTTAKFQESESDYESISPRLQRLNKTNANRQKLCLKENNGKNFGYCNNTGRSDQINDGYQHPTMVQSVMTDRKFDDSQSLSSHRSLPELNDANYQEPINHEKYRSSNRNHHIINRTHYRPEGNFSTELSDKINNNNVVITKLLERKETTFGVMANQDVAGNTQRSVRFSRQDEHCQASCLDDYCSSCSSSSSSDDEQDDSQSHFSYCTMVSARSAQQPKRERLKYVEPNFGTIPNKSSKKVRSKTNGGNCIVS